MNPSRTNDSAYVDLSTPNHHKVVYVGKPPTVESDEQLQARIKKNGRGFKLGFFGGAAVVAASAAFLPGALAVVGMIGGAAWLFKGLSHAVKEGQDNDTLALSRQWRQDRAKILAAEMGPPLPSMSVGTRVGPSPGR